MKCKCGGEVTFEIPYDMCAGCWFDWFHDRYAEESLCSEAELAKMKADFIKDEMARKRRNVDASQKSD